jgi:hypothetical protein
MGSQSTETKTARKLEKLYRTKEHPGGPKHSTVMRLLRERGLEKTMATAVVASLMNLKELLKSDVSVCADWREDPVTCLGLAIEAIEDRHVACGRPHRGIITPTEGVTTMPDDPTRRPIHVCDLCQAIWEGPTPPPATCPHCGGSSWKAAEVGNQPGMVGGRVFLPGTNTPMTRIFICQACKKMVVVRRGGPQPSECPQCKAAGGQLLEAAAPNKDEKKPTPTARTLADVAKDEYERQARAQPGYEPPRTERETLAVGRTITAEDYRKEWIAERVAEWANVNLLGCAKLTKPLVDLSLSTPPIDPAALVWDGATNLYDEGKKRGMLP